MLLDKLRAREEVCWRNPGELAFAEAAAGCPVKMAEVLEASARLDRFASYFKAAFPETAATGGLLESPLRAIPRMKGALEAHEGPIPGDLYIKLDSHLPVSGSIKARGGVYEVLKLAEDIVLKEGLIGPADDYAAFATDRLRTALSRYSIGVGSTGNLGLSIGIMGAALGFRVTVHMSADARRWKKELLRSKGVTVVEYPGDYSEAVKLGRAQAEADPLCHFVDDENSRTLFLGYAVAALRLQGQLKQAGVLVDAQHPLLVYLPCGVGGGPGGVAFGLRQVFGDGVRPFFAEPTGAPCMLLGMATGKHGDISVQDIGLDGRTAADGLAVGRASGFVGRVMAPFMTGCYTLTDERMYKYLAALAETEGILLEPSALAGMAGPGRTAGDPAFAGLAAESCTHLVWATGGSMVPEEEMARYLRTGKELPWS